MDIYLLPSGLSARLGAKHMRALMDYFETAEDMESIGGVYRKITYFDGKDTGCLLAYRNETSLGR